MARQNRRERKVRGSKIRSGRDDTASTARTRRAVDEREVASDAGDDDLTDRFLPEDETFVETPAVESLKARVDRGLSVDRPVHLVGPTGCGKTALAMAVARERDRPVVFVNGDADLTTADLVGEFAESERHTVRDKYVHNVQKSTDVVRDRWVDNPLTTAVKEGATLVYNEFSRTKPVANNVLLSVFEEGVLELPGQRGESRYVDVHPEFRTVLTSNSAEYAGVHTPQDALLDRLVGIHMDFYDAETERAIVRNSVPDVDPAVADGVVDALRALRDAVDLTIGTRKMVMTAQGLSTVETPDTDAVADVVCDVLGSKVSGIAELRLLREDVVDVLEDRTIGLTSDSHE
jgi:gas vesicle protein GvpN